MKEITSDELFQEKRLSPQKDPELLEKNLRLFHSFLHLNHPFYSTLLTYITLEIESTSESEKHQVYSKDNSKIIIDRGHGETWVEYGKERNMYYYIFHELLHIILLHKTRRNERNSEAWDISSDIVVLNQIRNDPVLSKLCNSRAMEQDTERLREYEEQIKDNQHCFVEDVYKHVTHKEKQKEVNNNDNTESNDERSSHDPWEEQYDEEEKENFLSDLKKMLRVASQSATLSDYHDDFHGDMKLIIDNVLKPQFDLIRYLNKIINSFNHYSMNYKRPDRRYLYQNLIVPGRTKNVREFSLLFYVDTSGSMKDDDLYAIISEALFMLKNIPLFTIDLVYADVQVNKIMTLTNKNYREQMKTILEVEGRGGTSFNSLFTLLDNKRKKGEKYQASLIFSDFYIDDRELNELSQRIKKRRDLFILMATHDSNTYFLSKEKSVYYFNN
ncbi:MAG: hypothetical protein HOG49_32670 [Candidatus Scalindua sp.]|jgi:predicted metal-dependent peptidase|nr:hypothetical protein [Candidatus Scalindua sp.]